MKQETFVENSHGRTDGDFYRTPALVTKAFCDEFALRVGVPGTVLDVGCGDGAIGKAIRQAWPKVEVHGIELDTGRFRAACDPTTCPYELVWQADWLALWTLPTDAAPLWQAMEWDLIIFNSPFKHALSFKRLALNRVRPGGHVASLVISQYDQETVHDDERGRFLDSLRKADGSEGYGQLKYKGRVDFRGDGNGDRVAYKWLVIGPGFEGSFVRVPRSPMVQAEQLTMGIA
jgi:SAM-dependent methyltransferase